MFPWETDSDGKSSRTLGQTQGQSSTKRFPWETDADGESSRTLGQMEGQSSTKRFPWEMDVDEESGRTLGQMEGLERKSSENESCGICRDIVIDRGVLDCCSHWFCYTCIDNWAAITNRCPLCKSEFQHITCTPVYGTIGATDEDEYSLTSCDDDWYVQEDSSTLSFPSYYIDAEAVVCLDDGDCKIRNGLVAAEDDSTLDTSIACDSCDKWYHAICVGFNPAMASDNSWLCPRCKFNEVEHEADVILKQNFSEECVIGSDRAGTNASFSGRVSVSVADEGETALVVSMVGVHSETRGGLSEASLGLKTEHETFNCSSYPSHSKDALAAGASSLENTDIFSRSQNKPSETSVVHTLYSEPTETSLQFSPIREPATTIFSSDQGSMSTERLGLPKLVSSCPVVDSSKGAKSTGEENAVEQSNNELSTVSKSPQPLSSDAVQQIKTAQNLQLPLRHDVHHSDDMKEEEDMESGNEVIHPAKKAKLEVQEQDINVIGNCGFSSTHSHATSPAKATDDDMSESVAQQKSIPDIMSIVEGDVYRRDPGRELAKPVGRRAGDKAGPRVKKIFRKEEGKESSALVQKLQTEIREVVRDTGTNILEKDGSFDEKLLTAFRAAIGKSVDGPAKGTNTNRLMRTRRSLLQKGKKRENLTKKLYGTSTGRRRSDWHRDWEVEFWKYRCSPGINPEKIETLQSVLQLLKKSSEMDKESAKGKKEENNNNSILSRLYLADASVVPRKDDIRPLSALAGCASLDKSSQIKANGNKSPNIPAAGTETMKISSPSSAGKTSSSSTLNKEASSRRENINSQPSQDKKNQSSGDIKQDKRKWALEILARKNASSVASKDQTEGTDALKGNFPLLAQLPMDMRPQLAAGSNKKVPVSVRQAQLHRIAEHYLQKANLDVIRRCADTELAIADAVNVEKGIYERSSSKSIYVNLCSQATRQHAKAKSDNDTSSLSKRTELGSDQISHEVTYEDTDVSGSGVEEPLNKAAVSDQKSELGDDTAPEHTVHKNSVSFSSAEDALRKAGLFDSPPNSPDRGTMEVEGESRLEEQSKNLQSNPKDVSSLKDDNSSLPTDLDAPYCQSLDTMSQQPELNSEEQQKLASKGQTEDGAAKKTKAANLTEADRCSEQCKISGGPGKVISVDCNMPDKVPGHTEASREMEKAAPDQSREDGLTTDGEVISKPNNSEPSKENSHSEKPSVNSKEPEADKPKNSESSKEKSRSDKPSVNSKAPKADKPKHAAEGGDDPKKRAPGEAGKNTPDASNSTHKKVEMFVKEQIRPLCKSGVITVDQYKWAVMKTTDKVMSFHRDAKNANFLIKEGDKVKKLALQYVEASQQKIS